jgi:hypothetical protein
MLLVGTRKGFKVQAPLVQQIEPCYLGRFCVLQHRADEFSVFVDWTKSNGAISDSAARGRTRSDRSARRHLLSSLTLTDGPPPPPHTKPQSIFGPNTHSDGRERESELIRKCKRRALWAVYVQGRTLSVGPKGLRRRRNLTPFLLRKHTNSSLCLPVCPFTTSALCLRGENTFAPLVKFQESEL